MTDERHEEHETCERRKVGDFTRRTVRREKGEAGEGYSLKM